MRRTITSLSLLVALAFALPVSASPTLPSGARWLEHLNKDLLPFWTSESAFGKPLGAFLSVRCNDRKLFNPQKPCPEIRSPPHQRYLVALSRQSYGYGVAFHLTGNRAYLDAMKAGIDFIRKNAMDRVNGGMATVQDTLNGRWGPQPERRNPQEMAYGVLGMAFYYYLTRDADVLEDILAVKKYIFEKYGAAPGALRWQPMVKASGARPDKQLVAQLDQMGTYLVLLTPILPDPVQTEWKESLRRIANIMIKGFYSPKDKQFLLHANLPLPPDQMLARTGASFGVSAKAFWMIRWAGAILGNRDLIRFAEEGAPALFKQAFVEDCGCWAEGRKPGGALNLNTDWWTHAEFDQLAGTLAPRNRTLLNYLSKTYQYWFDHFVDKDYGGIWERVDAATHEPARYGPKQWQWKSAYHSFEHALVGYIVAQQLQAKPVTLYYAFAGDTLPQGVQPYFFSGTVMAAETEKDAQGRAKLKVSFSNVH